ncbi:MAG: rRNA pseudouridine synthase [Candidatus Protistobacter heckmanni]|nr:rRNA pseudouridine synthase [Candidatus Protistobacter heckmanni]
MNQSQDEHSQSEPVPAAAEPAGQHPAAAQEGRPGQQQGQHERKTPFGRRLHGKGGKGGKGEHKNEQKGGGKAPRSEEVFNLVMAGEFDEPETAEGEAAAADKAKPVLRELTAEDDAPKLHKVLADAGIGSRRDMEDLILQGRVSVNGLPAHIGQRILATDQVRINGKIVQHKLPSKPPRLLLYHKPAGEIVSQSDPEGRPTVFDNLPRIKLGKWIAVGRIDFNTEGLLLFTTSGDLANRFMHPRYGVEREYAVRTIGEISEASRQSLLNGIELGDGTANFLRMADGGGEGLNHWYHVALAEGRNREVRRMFEAVGLTVSRLLRTRYGEFILPRGLKRGRYEELPQEAVKALLRKLGMKVPGGDAKQGGKGKLQQRNNNGGQPDPMQSSLTFLAKQPGGFKSRPRGDVNGNVAVNGNSNANGNTHHYPNGNANNTDGNGRGPGGKRRNQRQGGGQPAGFGGRNAGHQGSGARNHKGGRGGPGGRGRGGADQE